MPHIPKGGTPRRPGGGKHEGGLGGMGGNHRKQGCCSYERAAVSLLRGKGRLAVRYVRMDIKARMGLIGSRRLGTI